MASNPKKKKRKLGSVIPPRENGKHPGGRPSGFNPEMAERIVSAIKAGGYVETAAAFAGINKDTFYEWLKRGAKEKSGPFKEFSDAIGRAIAESEMRYVSVVAKAASGYDVIRERTVVGVDFKGNPINTVTTEKSHEFNPQAAEWWLERRFPRRWGRMERPEGSELPEGSQERPLMTLKRETVDIYAPDRLARFISAFGEAGLIPEEILVRLPGQSPAQAEDH